MQIHYLAARGDINGVQQQLETGVPVDMLGGHLRGTPLLYAAQDNRAGLDMLKLLIAQGANPNVICGDSGHMPLGVVARSGNTEKTRYLLQVGADVHLRNAGGYTPLIAATHSTDDKAEIIKLLLEAGTDPEVAPYHFPLEAPALVAYRGRKFESLKVLFDAGVSLADTGWTRLMYAIAYGTLDDIETQLKRSPTELQYAIDDGGTMWHFCLLIGDLVKAKHLLQKGIKRAHNELQSAVRVDNPALVQWLIQTGADIEARVSPWSDTALIKAAEYGAIKSMELLLAAGANVHTKNVLGNTALNVASNAEAIRILARGRADLNHLDDEGSSRLKNAAENGEIEVVRVLLELGANPDIRPPYSGETPLHIAIRYDYLEIAHLLLEAGADPNANTVDGWVPLTQVKTTDAADLLLGYGADRHATTNYGATIVECLDDDPTLISYVRGQMNG